MEPWLWLVVGGGVLTLLWGTIRAGNRWTDSRDFQTAGNFLQAQRDRGEQIRLVGGPRPSGLFGNEDFFIILPGTTLLEPRAVRVSRGHSRGPSIRIMRGLWFRFGTFGSVAESHDELREIDQGTLCVSRLRVVFVGSLRTVAIPLSKITALDPLADAVVIGKVGRDRPQYFRFGPRVGFGMNGQVAPVAGEFIVWAIQQARGGYGRDNDTRQGGGDSR